MTFWLQSSLSHKKTIIELDTNFDGVINSADETNGNLLGKVAATYINGRNNTLREMSPWFNSPLWNSANPPQNGTINLIQPANVQLIITAREKNGIVVYENIIFAN